VTTIASVTYDRAAFWRRTALRSQEQCVQYLERIEEQDTQMRRMQDLILELNKEAVDLQAAYENRGRRIADLEEEYATAMGQVSVRQETGLVRALALEESVDCIAASPHAISILKREGIHTLGDLTSYTPKGLLQFRGVGPQIVKQIEASMAEHDLELALGPKEIGAIGAGGLGVGYATVYGQRDLSIQK
jgi:DNA-directed RNA polymerase alpha subunit